MFKVSFIFLILTCHAFHATHLTDIQRINKVGFLSRPVGARMLSAIRNTNFLVPLNLDVNKQDVNSAQYSTGQFQQKITNTIQVQPVNQIPQSHMNQILQNQVNQIPQSKANQIPQSQMNQNPQNQVNQIPQSKANQIAQPPMIQIPQSQVNQISNLLPSQSQTQLNTMNQVSPQTNKLNKARIIETQNSQMQIQSQAGLFRENRSSFCNNVNHAEMIPHPQNPSQFVICYSADEFTIMNCPEHLVFNRFLARCDHESTSPINPCLSNPCQNGGVCINTQDFLFRCDCAPGFEGQHCQNINSCGLKSCGGDGVCVALPLGSPVQSLCKCNGATTFGVNCGQVEPNPCIQGNTNSMKFPARFNPSIFVQCEGTKPNFFFCPQSLVFSLQRQACDWTSK